MFSLKYSKRFKKDLKSFKHDKDLFLVLENLLDILIKGKPLPKKYYNHSLVGEFKGCYECHLKSDVLFIYKKNKKELLILLLRIGSHSDLF
ncbi:MAG TPA: type II toxin-antitoxin system YafQ family toxin [Patescibacteria group bacterium]|nr:type II toxin-antitoxin system YafQ family toxin [Patescibacteria group bacterium]